MIIKLKVPSDEANSKQIKEVYLGLLIIKKTKNP